MGSTDELVHEHRTILRVLGALEGRIREGEETGRLPVGFLRDLLAFSQGFIDRCHHAKEEGCLFPCLDRRGIPVTRGLVEVLLEEHATGRRLVSRIGDLLDRYEAGGAAAGEVLDACRSYVDLLREHVMKEDDVLFPAGEAAMEPADQTAVSGCFADREKALGDDYHPRLHRLAEELAGQ